MATKISVLGLILSSSPYLRSALLFSSKSGIFFTLHVTCNNDYNQSYKRLCYTAAYRTDLAALGLLKAYNRGENHMVLKCYKKIQLMVF